MESARVLIVPEGMARIFLLTSQGSISLETLSLDELLSLVPLLQTEPTGFEEDM